MSLINPVPQQIKAWEFPQLLISNHPPPLSISSKESKPKKKKKTKTQSCSTGKLKLDSKLSSRCCRGFPFIERKKKMNEKSRRNPKPRDEIPGTHCFQLVAVVGGGGGTKLRVGHNTSNTTMQCTEGKSKQCDHFSVPFFLFRWRERERTVVVFRPHKKLLFFGRGNANEKNKSRAQEWKK